jgi:hypothetical protein
MTTKNKTSQTTEPAIAVEPVLGTVNDWISINDRLPEKGVDVQVKISEDETYCVFRCACHNPNCKEWRDSLMGYALMINPQYWRPMFL